MIDIQWIQLTVGLIAFLLAIGLIIWEIITGLIQRRKLKKVTGDSCVRISLSLDYVAAYRVGVLLCIFIVISLIYLKQDFVLGTTLLIVWILVGIVWLASRPKEIGIKFTTEGILLLDFREKTIQSITMGNGDTDSFDVEIVDTKGESTCLEFERTDQNIYKIEMVKGKLLTTTKSG